MHSSGSFSVSSPSLGESSTTLPVLKGVIHSASWEVLDNSLARSALRACHHLREFTLTHQAGFTAQELTVLDDPEPCIAVLNVVGSYGPQLGNYHLKCTWCYSRAALLEAFNTYRRNDGVPLYFQVRKVDGNATMFCLVFSEAVIYNNVRS
ncbi:hypothetical protein GG344DRAFT_71058 [Lentinula edodes]|nr:hypothetical protein GG344DRAFT_71058 [Lentinula edodes]